MSDFETKYKRSMKRKRNFLAKKLYDKNSPWKEKEIGDKTLYIRKKINKRRIERDYEDGEI